MIIIHVDTINFSGDKVYETNNKWKDGGKGMKKFRTMCFVLGCLLMASVAMASPESEALVTQGRADLFNNSGNPSYTDLINANQHFHDAVVADASDQVANVFYGVPAYRVLPCKRRRPWIRDLARSVGGLWHVVYGS